MKSLKFAENLRYLRLKSGGKQAEMLDSIGFKRTTWNGYENAKSFPKLEDFIKIAEYFGISEHDLLHSDLQNVHLNKNEAVKKIGENVHLNVHPNVHLNGTFEKDNSVMLMEENARYNTSNRAIPITEIEAAAGGGIFNQEPVFAEDFITMPNRLLRQNGKYLCIRIKGISMAPSMADGGYVIIRELEKSEWAQMPDESVFVVVDKEGKGYIKRVKNRFKKGFIVLRSDSPDRISFPSINLYYKDIQSIWFAEMYFTSKIINIHDQYYSRLQVLEDEVHQLTHEVRKMHPKLT